VSYPWFYFPLLKSCPIPLVLLLNIKNLPSTLSLICASTGWKLFWSCRRKNDFHRVQARIHTTPPEFGLVKSGIWSLKVGNLGGPPSFSLPSSLSLLFFLISNCHLTHFEIFTQAIRDGRKQLYI